MIPTELKKFLESDFNTINEFQFVRNLKKLSFFSIQNNHQLQQLMEIIQSDEIRNFSDENRKLGIQLYRQLAILYCFAFQKAELEQAKENFKEQLKKNLFDNHWTSGGARVVSTAGATPLLAVGTYGFGAAYILMELIYIPLSVYSHHFPSEQRKLRITEITNALYQSIEAKNITNDNDIDGKVSQYHPRTGWSDGNWGFEIGFTAEAFEKSIFDAIDNISNQSLRTQYLQNAQDPKTPLGQFIDNRYKSQSEFALGLFDQPPELRRIKYSRLLFNLGEKIKSAEDQCIALFLSKTNVSLPNTILETLNDSLQITEKQSIRHTRTVNDSNEGNIELEGFSQKTITL
jgi:hypothetical protein